MSKPTIKDIAALSGVSYATVSRTLNQRSGVKLATKNTVLRVASELGYRPNTQARSLKIQQTFTIALIVPDISNPFFADIALAVNGAAYQQGYNTILCNAAWDADIEKNQLEMALNQRADGIIFKPTGIIPDLIANLEIPVVLISNLGTEGMTYIEVNNFRGGEDAAALLSERGYRRPAFIGGLSGSRSNADRLNGFRHKLDELGNPLSPQNIKNGSFSIQSGYQLIRELMRQSPPPDAAFCGNDLIALGVYQYLLENKVQVPVDFGIIGFDDVYLASLPQIQLTTIAQPRAEMGRLAAEILIEQIEKKETPISGRHVILEPQMIKRLSVR